MLGRLRKMAPSEWDVHNDLGTAYRAKGRLTEAVASYRRAIALNPDSAEAYSNLGITLYDLGHLEEAATACGRAVEIKPDNAIGHNNFGNALRGLGRLAEAELCYRRALSLEPDYLDALVNLGTALADLEQFAEARAIYRHAVRLHPDAAAALAALGRLLGRLGGADEETTQCLQRAIMLNPADANVCIELGNVLMRQGRLEDAMAVYRRAQALQPVITWRANKVEADFSVLFLDVPMAGSTPVRYLAGSAAYDRHFYNVLPGCEHDLGYLRGRGDVVFNLISNADSGKDSLPLLLDLVERLGRPTINHPKLIMATDRETVARGLRDVPGCIVPTTLRVSGTVLAAAASREDLHGLRPPLLVRLAGTHGGDDFEKITDWAGIAAFAGRRPEADHYVIEYLDYQSADGLFRKYRFIFIDGEILPYHLAIHNDWKVHYFRTEMSEHAWMRQEEARFLADPAAVFGASGLEVLRAAAAATALDYGGMDCALDRFGRVVVFEANASMLVHDEKADMYLYKNPAVARIKVAFDAMLARRVHQPAVPERDAGPTFTREALTGN